MDGRDPAGGPPPQRPPASAGAWRDPPRAGAAEAVAAGLPWSGALAEHGALWLCYLGAAAGATGRLDVETDGGTFAIHVRRGVVEHASSDPSGGELGRFLEARGAVSAGALREAERGLDRAGGDLVAALAASGAVDPARTFAHLQEHGLTVLARAFASRRGSASWHPGVAPPGSAFPLGSRWGVLCEAARRLDGQAVRAALGDRAERVAHRVGGRVDLDQLKLTALEARAVTLFDGKASPAQLAASGRGDPETLLRTAFLLAETELLAFGDRVAVAIPEPARPDRASPGPAGPPRAAARPRPAAASPAAPSPAAHAPAPPVPERSRVAASASPTRPERSGGSDLAALQAFHARIASADHFEVLGVARDAPSAQVKVAYFQLAKTYHPDAGPVGDPPDVKKLRADVFARVGEAWRVLGDDARRVEYVRELSSGGGARVDVSAIFKAEEAFRRATALVRSRQFPAALQALEEATALNPEEAEFGVWMAWVRFLVAGDRHAEHARSAASIEAALKKVPRCMPAYLFLALMAKLVGDPALAERHLRRGLELEPKDPELALELKHLRR